MKLNPQQNNAVHHIHGPLLVIAGAGSGKTRVITNKIAYLIERCQVKPHQITALTFTNKAAREMRHRVKETVSGSSTRGLRVSTFHTFGLNFIKREHLALGLKAGFTLLDDQDVKVLLKDLLFEGSGPDLELLDQARNQLSAWKSQMLSPEGLISQASTDTELRFAHLYKSYLRQLKAYNAVDFDDLIRLPTIALQENATLRERWQRRIQYLLVDEYQDTNQSQYELIKLLVGERARFTMVGDDDQSIYAWRGAAPENLHQLGVDFKQLEVIKLEQNYRSTNTILKAANTVIALNDHLYEKNLWSQLGPGEKINIWAAVNEREEAARIASDILSHKMRSGSSYGNYAVLYRSNHQSRLLELQLQQLQIPYVVSGSTAFFARAEIKDVVSYLRLIVNPEDDTAFLRIINIPRREIGPSTLEKLGDYATNRGISLLRATGEIGFATSVNSQTLHKLKRFTQWYERISEVLRERPLKAAVMQLLSDIDYQDWIAQQASSSKVAEKRWENVMSLVTMLGQMAETVNASDEDAELNLAEVKELEGTESGEGSGAAQTLEAVLNKVMLRDLLEQQGSEAETDRVQLMTLHSAKGLEFPQVHLMGVEEDTLPHRNSVEAHALQEERRLFYVGITRAQRQLSMSYATHRQQFGEKTACTPSRFLEEIPAECVDWIKEGEKRSAQQQQQTANSHLAAMRSLLND